MDDDGMGFCIHGLSMSIKPFLPFEGTEFCGNKMFENYTHSGD